jgi:hypothetical protein
MDCLNHILSGDYLHRIEMWVSKFIRGCSRWRHEVGTNNNVLRAMAVYIVASQNRRRPKEVRANGNAPRHQPCESNHG